MTNLRFKPNAMTKLRNEPGVKRDLAERAQRVADASGEGIEVRTGEGKSRPRAAVVTVTPRGMRRNMRDNTLVNNFNRAKG